MIVHDELQMYLRDLQTPGDPSGQEAVSFYADYHFVRFQQSLSKMPVLSAGARVLELGAAPFLMSVLMRRTFGYDVTTANFFGDYGESILEPRGYATLIHPETGEEFGFPYQVFNVECDRYPYDDETFDMVVCCEMLEHLATDPSHLLAECHRVLKSGGLLFLTTPNVASWGNISSLTRGANIFHCYTADGVYGRHNREYTAGEVKRLLEAHNFSASLDIDDAYLHPNWQRVLTRLPPLRRFRDNLFATGVKHGETRRVYPEWLYVGYQRKHPAAGQRIDMEDVEPERLGEGWHEYEHWPPGVRWTGEQAVAFLRVGTANLHRLGLMLHASAQAARGAVRVNGAPVGTFDIPQGHSRQIVLPLPETQTSLLNPGDSVAVTVECQTFVPSEVDPSSNDHRRLGVAVESLWLE